MLARGDLNRIIEEVNQILEKVFVRLQVLEDKVQALEAPAPEKKSQKAA